MSFIFEIDFSIREKSTIAQKFRTLSENRILSVVLLIGFTCIQLHALSHFDLHLDSEYGHNNSEPATTEDEAQYRQHEIEEAFECTYCVLTEHQQSLITQRVDLVVYDFPSFTAVGPTYLTDETTAYAINLRGPPLL
ncbi:MAG: hypothetical protein AAFW89_15085 [Bacteroidota bacterium]